MLPPYFKRTTLAALGALAFIPSAYAQTPIAEMPAGVYKIDPTHASLIWKVSHIGLSNYTARFTDFDADLNLNPENLEDSELSVIVNPLSVETDYPAEEKGKDFNKELATGESWFNAGTFADIKFTATDIEITGDNTGKVIGDLELLGVTKPITLDVVFNNAMVEAPFSKKPTLGFSATGTMMRSDWGFDTYVPNIGDEVTLLIEAEFIKPE